MALKQVEPVMEKVGNTKFYITPFAAFKAANLTGELASVLSPVIGAIAAIAGDKQGSILDVKAEDAANAISNCSDISGDKLEHLMRKLLLGGNISVEIENEDGELEGVRLDEDLANEIFCGGIQDMFVLCFYVIKLNFGGFFEKLAAQSGKAKAAQKKIRKIL